MKKHLEPESLSAYLDGELDRDQRTAVEEHLGSCAECSAVRARLASAMGSVAALGPVTMTADEHRVVRQAILNSRPAASGARRFSFPQFALAGGLVIVAFTALAFSFFRPGERGTSQDALSEAAAPSLSAPSFKFESGEEVDRTVAALPEVTEGVTQYRAGDAPRRDSDPERVEVFTGPGTAAGGATQGAPAPMARAENDSAGNAAPAPGPVAGAPGPAGGGSTAQGSGSTDEETATTQGSASTLFSPQAADECLGKVVSTQSYPMIPLVAREASFEGRPAWLLVFAWSPDASGNEPLDQWQTWLVDPVECRDLSGPELAARALYRSYSPAR
jgi:hypothetical protein